MINDKWLFNHQNCSCRIINYPFFFGTKDELKKKETTPAVTPVIKCKSFSLNVLSVNHVTVLKGFNVSKTLENVGDWSGYERVSLLPGDWNRCYLLDNKLRTLRRLECNTRCSTTLWFSNSTVIFECVLRRNLYSTWRMVDYTFFFLNAYFAVFISDCRFCTSYYHDPFTPL